MGQLLSRFTSGGRKKGSRENDYAVPNPPVAPAGHAAPRDQSQTQNPNQPDSQAPQQSQQPRKFSKEEGKVLVRGPGSVRGGLFAIEDLKDCDVWVCDCCASVTVDECVGCRVFIAAVSGSVFARDCRDCVFVAASQQWRTRSCTNCDVSVCCASGPVVESCQGVRVSCWALPPSSCYEELAGQLECCGIDASQNLWSKPYDFTPSAESFSVVSSPTFSLRQLPFDQVPGLTQLKDPSRVIVPRTAPS